MKRRILSLFLVIAMVFGMLPVSAFAAEDMQTIVTGDTYAPNNYLSVITQCEISGAEVTYWGVKESGTVWNVTLAADTALDTELNYTIHVYNYGKPSRTDYCNVSFNGGEYTAVDGSAYTVNFSGVPEWSEGTATVTFATRYNNKTTADRNRAYTLNLTLDDGVNDPPVLASGNAANADLRVGETYAVNLGEIFKDSDSMNLNYSVSVNDADSEEAEKAFSYVPQEAGTYTLVFTASDDDSTSEAYTVTLNVRDNIPPAIAEAADSTEAEGVHGIPWTVDLSQIFTDADGDALTYTVSVNEAEAIGANSSYTYAPDSAGTHTLVFQATDIKGAQSPAYTVTLTAAENPAPGLAGDAERTTQVNQYSAWNLDLGTLFSDNEGDNLTYTVSVNNAAPVNANQNYTYTPQEEGEMTFVFQATDLAGNQSPVCNYVLTVNHVGRTVITTSCTGSDAGDTWVKSITLTGADTVEAVWNIEPGHKESEQHILNVRFHSDTPDDAVIQLAYAMGYKTFNGSISGPSSVSLEDGKGSVTVKATGWMGNSGIAKTYILNFTNKANQLPTAPEENGVRELTTGDTFTLDLSTIFTDPENETLTYSVTYNGETVSTGADFSKVISTSGEHTFVFTATDSWGAQATYTVTVTALQASSTYDVTVFVPEAITPAFYITSSCTAEGDVCGEQLEAAAGESAEGMVPYTVKVPENVSQISVRGTAGQAEDWGGMAFTVSDGAKVTLRQVKLNVTDYNQQPASSTNTIVYNGNLAMAGTAGWLLAVGQEYSVTAVPADSSMVQKNVTATLEAGDGIATIDVSLEINNPFTITVTTGAKAQLYKYNKYYDNTEFDAKIVKDNGDGTTTYYFVADSKESLIYRVSMDGKITKAGWNEWGKQNLTILHTQEDKASDYRLDDYSATGQANSAITEDSVLLNINSRNHLTLSVGDTKTLKAYRAWEIIPQSYNNYILTPDFTYTVLSGEDVVKLTPKASPSTADGDWMTLTALKEGIAVIEVTYGAMEASGGGYDGVYGASDPARTGFVVVQVGGAVDNTVDFGIDCFASAGKSGKKNISYNPDAKYVWDAEFDTLYFTQDSGTLKLNPSAESEISEVAVSNDKGNTWTVLSGENGTYTAPIVSGNNILRVTTPSGTGYQVVRGDRVTVQVKEVADSSDGDGIIEAGEKIRVTLLGLHMPIPKMAGNYNPGYMSNYDGYNGVHLNYSLDGNAIYGTGTQYNFITAANYIELTVPENADSVTLTDGYIGLGVIGLTQFASGGDSHRNIPDGGCATRDSKTTYHTRSILPEIVIEMGGESAPNNAPIAKTDAVKEASIQEGKKYAINPETLFTDVDGDVLTFTVSVNNGKAENAEADYKFDPEAPGTYTLTFVCSDGEYTAEHTITLTVMEKEPEKPVENEFGLLESEVAGYVTISFEDHGIRVAGETGLKFPTALGTIIEATQVPFLKDETVAQVTIRLLDHLKIGYEYSGTVTNGFYLGAIKNFEVDDTPYDAMGEFDAGVGSGWMITQNDVFINKGASEFQVKNGDVIKWQYTCQLGADIGDDYNQTMADNVKNLISAIGIVTKDSADAIEAARSAYEALTSKQKTLVSNYDVLVAAEKAFAELNKPAEPTDPSAPSEPAEPSQPTEPEYQEMFKTTGDYMEALGTPTVNSIGGEWMVLGLVRSGRAVPAGYYDEVVKYVRENINDQEQLHRAKSTENARVILALTAAGYDVTNVDGHNLLLGLNTMSYVKKQGNNGPVWALIAFDSHDYVIPGGDVTREALIEQILSVQLPDGGWTMSSVATESDADLTAMAVQALAPYYETNEKVKAAVDQAIALLSKIQEADGSFGSVDGSCAESTAQVIVALCTMGIDPAKDTRFIKSGKTLFDGLAKFYVSGGGFKHIASDEKINGMATEQGYYALTAYHRFLNEKTSLYDMSDVEIHVKPEINVLETYNDLVKGAWYMEAVDYVVNQGLMKGISDTEFAPDSKTTRAMMATILYRIAGEPSVEGMKNPFDDVKPGQWFYEEVVWAANAGIVKGISATKFDPDASITREQMVTMMYRYMDEPETDSEAYKSFKDANTVGSYAVDAIAWAVENGIINGVTSDTLVPTGTATRAQIATILMRNFNEK